MNIFVAKLHARTTSKDLEKTFEAFGEVSSAKVIMDKDTGQSKKFGFVEMPDNNEAQNAIDQLDNTDLQGSTIVVKEARPREEGANRGGGGGYRR